VPTMETLYALVDMLASWKINQFQLYTEHTFAYRRHRTVWANASPMTAEEVLALDVYCRDRFIELVPNQNSFGHMHRWLMHEPYVPLGETEIGITTPWGNKQDYPFSLSPAVPETLPFLEGLFDELLPNFTSRMFNIGADETFDLGAGRSKALVEAKGKGRVYLDFVLEIYQRVRGRGRTMQFWGDIINQYPDLVAEVPKDVIALEWGYEANHDFPGKTALFAASGVPFYVCPGTSSWVTIAGRTDNAIGNIRSAVENGLKHGAIGVLNTDWGDLGHWQPLPVSFLGYAYGAALSWGYANNVDLDLPAALSAFAFQDKAGVMGRLAYNLGNAYQKPGIDIFNGSFLFWIYQRTLEQLREFRSVSQQAAAHDDVLLARNLQATAEYVDQDTTLLDQAQMARPDAELIQHEFATVARMLQHAARRGLAQIESSSGKASLLNDLDAIEADYRRNWLARNRPGGLEDSVQRLRRARELYQS
jgi:hexosaminidase